MVGSDQTPHLRMDLRRNKRRLRRVEGSLYTTCRLPCSASAQLRCGSLRCPSHVQVAVFGVITAPVWLTALLLGRAWMHLASRWRQQHAEAFADGDSNGGGAAAATGAFGSALCCPSQAGCCAAFKGSCAVSASAWRSATRSHMF